MQPIRVTSKSPCKTWVVAQVRANPGITFLELSLNDDNPSKAKDKKNATSKVIEWAIADGLIKTRDTGGGYEAIYS